MFSPNLIKKDSLAFLIESRDKSIISSGISCMSVWQMIRMRQKMFSYRQRYASSQRSKFVMAAPPESINILAHVSYRTT